MSGGGKEGVLELLGKLEKHVATIGKVVSEMKAALEVATKQVTDMPAVDTAQLSSVRDLIEDIMANARDGDTGPPSAGKRGTKRSAKGTDSKAR